MYTSDLQPRRCPACCAPLSQGRACHYCGSTFTEGPHLQTAPVRLEGPRHGEAIEALKALDQAWAQEERTHLRRGRDGREALPTHAQAMGRIALGIAVWLFLPFILWGLGFPGVPVQLVGLALIGYGLLTLKRARDYDAARDRYMDRRAERVNLREGI